MNLHDHIEQIQQLDDDALLHSLKRFVASSNHLTALVLAHLAEVDARRAYRKWACDTLTTYCVYELRLSEDEAQRRCRAARTARQFPILFEMLADASIHLTGILLLTPYLTEENHRDVLARARYRRKSEILKLVAELAPLCDVPAVVEPLGPLLAKPRAVSRTGWAVMNEAVMGGVRRLVPGDGPSQAPGVPEGWRDDLLVAIEGEASEVERMPDGDSARGSVPARSAAPNPEDSAPARNVVEPPVPPATLGGIPQSGTERLDQPVTNAPDPAGARSRRSMRYKVQFTADQEYVDLLERARALLWHQLQSGDLAQLQKLAVQALVEKLLRRKCAVAQVGADVATAATGDALPGTESAAQRAQPLQVEPKRALRDSGAPEAATASGRRRIPAAVRRAVWQRDGGRCAFVDERGVRCPGTGAIEFHHQQPYARGGPHTVENISLRCRAHNDLAAEGDFGLALMQRRKQGIGAHTPRASARLDVKREGEPSRLVTGRIEPRGVEQSPLG